MSLLPARPKVFGIGFHKTATTSLANALYTLGYDVGGYFGIEDVPEGTSLESFAIERAGGRDAVQDMPWPVLYEALDQAFPGSKFILTERDTEKWISSVVTHFGRRSIPTQQMIYGVDNPADHREVYIERYERHNRDVREYFEGRDDDLLIVDLTKGDGWDVLCPFLGVAEPSVETPRQNTAGARSDGRVARIARRTAGEIGSMLGRSNDGRLDDPRRAYGLGHHHCRRIDAVGELASAVDGDLASAAQLAHADLVSAQRRWLVDVGAVEAERIDSLEWSDIVVLLRRWVGDLDFELIARVIPGGETRNGDALVSLVADGRQRIGQLVSEFDELGVTLSLAEEVVEAPVLDRSIAQNITSRLGGVARRVSRR